VKIFYVNDSFQAMEFAVYLNEGHVSDSENRRDNSLKKRTTHLNFFPRQVLNDC